MTPVVLVTADRREGSPGPQDARVRPRRAEVWLGEAYVSAVRAAGGLPLVVPPGEAPVERLLEVADAVVLTGGYFDIHPSLYGEDVEGRLDRVEPARTALELALAAAALERGLPVLGVCGGMQALAVAAGGRLIQDLPGPPNTLAHEQPTDPAAPWHQVRVEGQGRSWLGAEVLHTNSTHHQAVREPGQGLIAAGWAEDGVVEVVVGTGPGFALGVQWHPELLGDHRPFRALVEAARAR